MRPPLPGYDNKYAVYELAEDGSATPLYDAKLTIWGFQRTLWREMFFPRSRLVRRCAVVDYPADDPLDVVPQYDPAQCVLVADGARELTNGISALFADSRRREALRELAPLRPPLPGYFIKYAFFDVAPDGTGTPLRVAKITQIGVILELAIYAWCPCARRSTSLAGRTIAIVDYPADDPDPAVPAYDPARAVVVCGGEDFLPTLTKVFKAARLG